MLLYITFMLSVSFISCMSATWFNPPRWHAGRVQPRLDSVAKGVAKGFAEGFTKGLCGRRCERLCGRSFTQLCTKTITNINNAIKICIKR